MIPKNPNMKNAYTHDASETILQTLSENKSWNWSPSTPWVHIVSAHLYGPHIVDITYRSTWRYWELKSLIKCFALIERERHVESLIMIKVLQHPFTRAKINYLHCLLESFLFVTNRNWCPISIILSIQTGLANETKPYVPDTRLAWNLFAFGSTFLGGENRTIILLKSCPGIFWYTLNLLCRRLGVGPSITRYLWDFFPSWSLIY